MTLEVEKLRTDVVWLVGAVGLLVIPLPCQTDQSHRGGIPVARIGHGHLSVGLCRAPRVRRALGVGLSKILGQMNRDEPRCESAK